MLVQKEDVFDARRAEEIRGRHAGNAGSADDNIGCLSHEFENLAFSSSQLGSTRIVPSGKTMVGTLR